MRNLSSKAGCGRKRLAVFFHGAIQRIIIAVSIWWVMGGMAALAVNFPGPDPGPTKAKVRSGRLLIQSHALTASWSIAGGKLKPVEIRSKFAAQTLVLSGEAFQIRLQDGACYSASELAVDE